MFKKIKETEEKLFISFFNSPFFEKITVVYIIIINLIRF